MKAGRASADGGGSCFLREGNLLARIVSCKHPISVAVGSDAGQGLPAPPVLLVGSAPCLLQDHPSRFGQEDYDTARSMLTARGKAVREAVAQRHGTGRSRP